MLAVNLRKFEAKLIIGIKMRLSIAKLYKKTSISAQHSLHGADTIVTALDGAFGSI